MVYGYGFNIFVSLADVKVNTDFFDKMKISHTAVTRRVSDFHYHSVYQLLKGI